MCVVFANSPSLQSLLNLCAYDRFEMKVHSNFGINEISEYEQCDIMPYGSSRLYLERTHKCRSKCGSINIKLCSVIMYIALCSVCKRSKQQYLGWLQLFTLLSWYLIGQTCQACREATECRNFPRDRRRRKRETERLASSQTGWLPCAGERKWIWDHVLEICLWARKAGLQRLHFFSFPFMRCTGLFSMPWEM